MKSRYLVLPENNFHISKSSNNVYNVPLLDSSHRHSAELDNQSSSSDTNMAKPSMPQYRQRWTLSKENLKCSPKK